jgi:hypothetical protein
MRRLISTLALLAVLAGLGGYIYFDLSKTPADATPKQEKLFGTLEGSKVEELTVKSESGDVTSLKKDAGSWKMTSPLQVPAYELDATGVANALTDLDIERVVDENPTGLKDYGLDPPRMQIDFKADEGKTTGRLLIGAKTPTGNGLFVKREDQKRVVLVGQYHELTFNKSTFDLRDKTILKVDRNKVDGAELTVSGKTAAFQKTGSDWAMTKPKAARADFSALEGLLGHIDTLMMKSIVSTAEPTPADLKKYGLDKPEATVTLHLGSARASLLFGGKADEATTYVKDASRPDVFTVDNASVTDFKKAADDYRKRELFDFRAFSATHLEITSNGQTVTLDRVKAKEDGQPDTWHRTTPTAGDADRQKVETLLAGLADIRATSFVDTTAKTGLDKPAMVVVAKFDDGKKEERVVFGKNGSDVFASRADDPGAAKVESGKFDDAMKNLDEVLK